MSNELNVTYSLSVRHQLEAVVKPLASVIDEIRSDRHSGLKKAIYATEDNDKKIKAFKEQLPIFLASLVSEKPTGIVSFDIDKKDNPGLEFAALKDCLEKTPSCVYAFESPRGGIKFGILTDFTDDGIDKSTMKQRYGIAYDRTLEYLKKNFEIDFVGDRANRSIYQNCFLSHDPYAYFNPNCEKYEVNHNWTVLPPTQSAFHRELSDEFVLELLGDIPRDLEYDERLLINYAVLSQLGESGIAPLVAHWDKEDKHELERKIRDQLRNVRYGSIGHLINVAKKHGYKEAKGRARNHLKPRLIAQQVDALVSVEEGIASLKETVRLFFKGNRNVFLNISTGAGKSSAVLDILIREIPRDKRTLILVPSHRLGEELLNKFNSLRKEHIETQVSEWNVGDAQDSVESSLQDLKRLKVKNRQSKIVHLRGQQGEHGLCEMKDNHFHRANRNVPWKECSRCPMSTGCKYIDQFNGLFDNIRIMTHNEWMNLESIWFAGHDSDNNGDPQPRQAGGWKPDYIVIDENIFNVRLDETKSDRGERFQSIKQVIDDVARGVPLSDAIILNRNALLEDAKMNNRPNYPRSDLSETDYQIAMNEYDRKMNEFSTVLENLVLYATTNKDRFLLGVWPEGGAIHHAPVNLPESRYENIPTLFLDATANEAVVRRFVPNIEFHHIAIRSNPEVKLYQLANASVTMNKLTKPEYLENLIVWLRKIIADGGYRNVGLITYKEIEGVKGLFDEHLANEVGAMIFGHFGAIRGVNVFENTDCLLIVGRNFIGTNSVKTMAAAIFGEALEYKDAYVDKPVRMIDGTFRTINCRAAIEFTHNAINQHYSLGETIQAIGRARSIHGGKKDVYYFSNESLGLDVEVTDFFYQDAPASNVVPTEAISEIIKTGYVQNKPSELIKIGISENIVKNHRNKIIDELDALGIQHLKFDVIDNKNRSQEVSYFVERIDLFEIGNRIGNKTIKAIVSMQ